jgi:2-oxo-4-hydroxy-4-carboxy-5-ureidoimidazoline decarboxylase
VTLGELNASTKDEFVQAIGWVFENSPWVAERAWRRCPFSSFDDLSTKMIREVQTAKEGEQLALLRAHPDLGTRAKVSASSAAEQSGAGLDQLSTKEFDLLQRLNGEYRKKFGFPFLFAVKGSDKTTIIDALRRRVTSTPEQEFQVALGHVFRIARFRLEDTVR